MKVNLKYVLILIAALAVIHAIRISFRASEIPKTASPLVQPAKVSFDSSFIAGSGIVEPKSELIEIASPVAGLVTEVFAQVGKDVKKGDVLFKIDSRARAAEALVAEASTLVAKTKMEESQRLFQIIESLKAKDPLAVSRDLYETRFGAMQVVSAAYEKAKADQNLVNAELDRLTVKSPIDGKILQNRLRAGEYAGMSASEPLMILGDVSDLHVRIDIDENDAWRFSNSAKAEGYIRGNPSLKLELDFVTIEPYVIPKKSLNGGTVERVDTRVLQVIYRIAKADMPPFVGQLVDVYLPTSS